MIKSFVALVAGYAIFAFPVAALFLVAGRDPHATLSIAFTVFSIIWGMAFAALGGYVTARLAPFRPFVHTVALAILMAIATFVSILFRPAGTPIWSQLAALLLMVPSVIVGGFLRTRRPGSRMPW